MLYETHMHTPLCRHAVGEPEEYAAVARQVGLVGITVTCHNPLPNRIARHIRMDESQFPEYLELVERARRKLAGKVDVRLGLEADYLPGLEEYLRAQLASAPFDYVLGSVHPHMAEYQKLYFRGSVSGFQCTYFEHLADAAETRLFDCLAHPDIVKIQHPDQWDFATIQPAVETALDRIAATGVAMELNTSGAYKTLPEFNPGSDMLSLMLERNIPVVIGADAHLPARTGDLFSVALEMLAHIGFQTVSYFIARQRIDVSIKSARRRIA